MVRSERLLGWLLGRTLISEGRSRNVKVCWMHMKAIRVSHFGGPDHLVLKDQEVVPTAQREGTAVVKVFSAGVNPVDTYIRSGVYGKLPDLPYTPGTDGAGVVTEVGKGTHKVKVGDRVFVTSVLGPRGTYAQYCLAMESNVHILPDNVSFDAGAAIGVPYRTAYRAMFHSAGVSSDQRVFVHGASGGVGLAAVQMARDIGAEVIGSAGSTDGMKLVRDAGAHKVLNHRSEDYLEELRDQCDLVVEMLANVNLGKDLGLLKKRGKVVVVGSRGPVEINPRDLMTREASISGVFLVNSTAEENQKSIDYIVSGLASGSLRPHIGTQYDLSDAAAAHEQVTKSSGALGKIVLRPWGDERA